VQDEAAETSNAPSADLNHNEKANLLKMKSNRRTVRGSGRKKGDDEQAQVQRRKEKEPYFWL